MVASLVSADIDLRDFAYMPLDVVRLRDSDLAAISSGDGFRAAVLLWCASWHQVPAASVPSDDRVLSRLAGYGRDIEAWLQVREDALRGFIECDDGRLYHPVVAEKAIEAWSHKIKQRERTEAARKFKALRDSQRAPVVKDTVTDTVTESVTENVTSSKGTERNGTERVEVYSLRSDDFGASAEKPKPDPKPTPRSQLVDSIGPELAAEVVEHRNRMRKPLTAEAAKRLAKQFVDTGAPQDAARMMIDNAWQGFNAEWFENTRARAGPRSAVLPFPSTRQQDFSNAPDRSASSAAKRLAEKLNSGGDPFG